LVAWTSTWAESWRHTDWKMTTLTTEVQVEHLAGKCFQTTGQTRRRVTRVPPSGFRHIQDRHRRSAACGNPKALDLWVAIRVRTTSRFPVGHDVVPYPPFHPPVTLHRCHSPHHHLHLPYVTATATQKWCPDTGLPSLEIFELRPLEAKPAKTTSRRRCWLPKSWFEVRTATDGGWVDKVSAAWREKVARYDWSNTRIARLEAAGDDSSYNAI